MRKRRETWIMEEYGNELKNLGDNERLYGVFIVKGDNKSKPILHRWKTLEDIVWDITEIKDGKFEEYFSVYKTDGKITETWEG